MNRTLPFLSITSHCCLELLNSMLPALVTSPLWFTAGAPAAMLGASAGKLTCRRGVNDQNTSNIMANKSAKSKQQKSKSKKPAAKKSASKKK
jgi:hypothetical protein